MRRCFPDRVPLRVFAFTLAVGTLLIGTCAAQVNTAPDATPRTSNPVPSDARLPQNA